MSRPGRFLVLDRGEERGDHEHSTLRLAAQHGVAGSLGAGGAGRELRVRRRSISKKGENRTPEYLAINPTGKVPGLVDGGQAYFESAAIIIHLGETYGRERGLWPAAGAGAARARGAVLDGLGHDRAARLHDAVAVSRRWTRWCRTRPPIAARRPPTTTTASTCACSTRSRRASPAATTSWARAFSLADIPAASALLVGFGPRRQRRGPQEHRRLARPLPRPPGLRAHRRRGVGLPDRKAHPSADVLAELRASWPDARVKQCPIKIGREVTFNSLRLQAWRRGFAALSRSGNERLGCRG